MKTVIYLNRWGSMLHLLLGRIEDDTHRRVRSQYCSSTEEARQVVAHWQAEHGVLDEDVRDNSAIDLDDLVWWMDFDLEDATDGEVAGVVH
ncbi:MAG: hypothetical protein K2X82_15540 [Gemmataceae bacterium]|nr:hypothetical protein [Gemmataceae bacterium]